MSMKIGMKFINSENIPIINFPHLFQKNFTVKTKNREMFVNWYEKYQKQKYWYYRILRKP